MGKKSGEDTGVSQESIQAMVRLLVRQEMERIAGEVPVSDIGTLTSQQLQPETEKKPAETVIEDLNEEGPPIDERTMQDIADAMAAFRNYVIQVFGENSHGFSLFFTVFSEFP